jgi:hypothetical protein
LRGEGVEVATSEIDQLEVRRTSAARTTGLVIGMVASIGAVALYFLLQAATNSE